MIPLKKPGKDDYIMAKTWRPISLLVTLGKLLESAPCSIQASPSLWLYCRRGTDIGGTGRSKENLTSKQEEQIMVIISSGS